MAEAHHLQGIRPIQQTGPLCKVNGEVLIRIVVVHVNGDIELHAADGVDQRLEASEVHQHGVVHRNPQLIGHHLGQKFHAAGVVGGVDLVILAVEKGLAVTGNTDAVCIAGGGVHRQENIGVAAAVAVVHAGD